MQHIVARLVVSLLLTACGAVAAESTAVLDAGPDAQGKDENGCCPISPAVSGCMALGGSRSCGRACDFPCTTNWRRERDANGCLEWRHDSVPNCDSSTMGGGSGPGPCAYPNIENEAGCPFGYADSVWGSPCPNVGLRCQYPGQGARKSDGCFETPVLRCAAVVTVSDGGGDAADLTSARWTLDD